MYYLKEGYNWKPGSSIPAIEIEPIMFFSRYFTRVEQCYNSSKLEIACLVWVCKRLYILLYSNNKRIIIFTDHNSINDIMKNINLNTISTNRINRRLTNTSVYLSIYLLNIYHISGRLNLVPDIFLCFQTVGNDVIQVDNEAEPALDII